MLKDGATECEKDDLYLTCVSHTYNKYSCAAAISPLAFKSNTARFDIKAIPEERLFGSD